MAEFMFSGPQPGFKDPRKRNKGIMAARRAIKRKEAELRNAQTPIERTKFWRNLSQDERNELSNQNASALSGHK